MNSPNVENLHLQLHFFIVTELSLRWCKLSCRAKLAAPKLTLKLPILFILSKLTLLGLCEWKNAEVSSTLSLLNWQCIPLLHDSSLAEWKLCASRGKLRERERGRERKNNKRDIESGYACKSRK